MAIRTIDDSILQGIAEEIQAKDGGDKMLDTEMRGRIRAIPTGAPVTKKVNFFNYDGRILYSYTANEIANLAELPEAPTAQGLTFQTWNWNLSDIKSWAQSHVDDNLPVGAVFITDDGHTRIKMHLREPQMASFPMPFCIRRMTGAVVIDWGDGSIPETITAAGIYSHTWQVNQYPADVVIDIDYTPTDNTDLVLGRVLGITGYSIFDNNPYYGSCVTAVEIGEHFQLSAGLYSRVFNLFTNMVAINIPNGVTSPITALMFGSCNSVECIVIPPNLATIGDDGFTDCYSLKTFSHPNNISIGTFRGFYNLASIFLSDDSTWIGITRFQRCYNLALESLPAGITGIGRQAFDTCYNLALESLPAGITSIGDYAFQDCRKLRLSSLPSNITNISAGTFNGCIGITSMIIHNKILTIGANAFYGCTSLYFIDLTKFTDPQFIPTLANANAFQGIPAQAQFQFANQTMLDAFAAATNWSTLSSKFVVKGATT